MNKQTELDWDVIRTRGELFPESALQFVREGLKYTVQHIHGARTTTESEEETEESSSRHVTGRDLCIGLRDLALQRYGMLAGTVLQRWGIRSTDDFGTIVYYLIDRGELRSSEEDDIAHFRGVYDFESTFPPPSSMG